MVLFLQLFCRFWILFFKSTWKNQKTKLFDCCLVNRWCLSPMVWGQNFTDLHRRRSELVVAVLCLRTAVFSVTIRKLKLGGSLGLLCAAILIIPFFKIVAMMLTNINRLLFVVFLLSMILLSSIGMENKVLIIGLTIFWAYDFEHLLSLSIYSFNKFALSTCRWPVVDPGGAADKTEHLPSWR